MSTKIPLKLKIKPVETIHVVPTVEAKLKPYYGEIKCEKVKCKNKAYYEFNGGYFCGVHSKSNRTQLVKISSYVQAKKKAELLVISNTLIEDARKKNKDQGLKGKVIVSQLKMMKEPDDHKGFLKVFPNFKHQNRRDGFGCRSLSPMSLGPVDHGQPNLPQSFNIENFHQGSKCFQEEIDSKGDPSKIYYENRLKFYLDKTAHRHKYKGTGKNKNIPVFFIWVDKDGKEHRLNYTQSKQFYCHFYEKLASIQPDYLRLLKLIENGTNIQICGYDGRSIGNRPIEEEYLDESKPFGHELVLATMLIEKPENYPWKKYKTFDF